MARRIDMPDRLVKFAKPTPPRSAAQKLDKFLGGEMKKSAKKSFMRTPSEKAIRQTTQRMQTRETQKVLQDIHRRRGQLGPRSSLPRLGGGLKPVRGPAPKPKMNVPKSKTVGRLGSLQKAEKAVSKAGKSQVARVLGTRIGARILPALAIAMTAKEVYNATKEGVNAYVAHKDLERTREVMQKRYGNVQRAIATRKALTKRR